MNYNRIRKNRKGGQSDDNGGGRKAMNLRFGSKQRVLSRGELEKRQSPDNGNLRLQEAGSTLIMSGSTKMN